MSVRGRAGGIRRLYGNLRAKHRTILYTGSLLFFIVLLVGLVAFSFFTSVFNQQNHDTINQQLAYAERNMLSEINAYTRVLGTMYLDRSFHELIEACGEPADNYIDYAATLGLAKTYIQTLLSGCESVPEVCLYPEAAFPFSVNDVMVRSNRSVRDEPWYRAVTQSNRNQIMWQVYTHVFDNGQRQLRISAALSICDRKTGARIAVVRLMQKSDWFMRAIVSTINLQSGTLCVLDAQDTPVLLSGSGAHALFDDLTWRKDAAAHTDTGHRDITLAGKPYTMYYRYSPKMDWQLIYMTDRSVHMEQLLSTGRLFLVLILLILVLSVFLVIFSSNMLTKRLVRLTDEVRHIDEGNLTLQDPPYGSDEVGDLADAFTRMLNTVRTMLKKNRDIERERYAAELQVLQERINPHFLYNTLSSVCAMAVDIDAYDISDALSAIAAFYRLSLSHGADIIPIGDELRLLGLYADICALSYGERVTIAVSVEPGLEQCLTPKLILQPFVENAILHGFAGGRPGGAIRVAVSSREGGILFEIQDDGAGMDARQLDRIVSGTYTSDDHHAINNIDRRIKLHFGADYGVRVQSRPGQGTTVRISIPRILNSTAEQLA